MYAPAELAADDNDSSSLVEIADFGSIDEEAAKLWSSLCEVFESVGEVWMRWFTWGKGQFPVKFQDVVDIAPVIKGLNAGKKMMKNSPGYEEPRALSDTALVATAKALLDAFVNWDVNVNVKKTFALASETYQPNGNGIGPAQIQGASKIFSSLVHKSVEDFAKVITERYVEQGQMRNTRFPLEALIGCWREDLGQWQK